MTNDYHDHTRVTYDRNAGQTRLPTTLIRSQCRANTTTHDSDTITMPGKARRNIS